MYCLIKFVDFGQCIKKIMNLRIRNVQRSGLDFWSAMTSDSHVFLAVSFPSIIGKLRPSGRFGSAGTRCLRGIRILMESHRETPPNRLGNLSCWPKNELLLGLSDFWRYLPRERENLCVLVLRKLFFFRETRLFAFRNGS